MRKSLTAILIAGCAAAAGCGGADYGTPTTVTGKITANGSAAAGVNVTFHAISEGLPAELRSHSTETGPDGGYTLQSVYPATYDVMIQEFNYNPEEAPADPSGAPVDDAAGHNVGPAPATADPTLIAEVPAEAADGGRRVTVSPESNHFDFDISK